MPAASRIVLAMLVAAAGCDGCRRSGAEWELRGTVTDAAGHPIAGAMVFAHGADEPHGRQVRTGRDGSFVLTLVRGRPFALTATHESGTAAYRAPESLSGSTDRVTITLGEISKGFMVEGRVVAGGSLPAEVTVVAGSENRTGAGTFVTVAELDGRYRLRLPLDGARRYTLRARTEGGVGAPHIVRELHDQTVDLHLHVPAPLPAPVTDWVRRAAVGLQTVEAGRGFDDLAAVDAIVGDAQVVGLGETSHAAHELLQLKHRLIEYLVLRKGFRGIACEATAAEARRWNDYVVHGRGSAAEAVAGLRPWDNAEVRSMLDWMRAFNENATPQNKLEVFGFDMNRPNLAAAGARAILERVDPTAIPLHEAMLSLFGSPSVEEQWRALSHEARHSHRISAEALVARLDARRDEWVRRVGLESWRDARTDARALAQWAEVHARDSKPGDFDGSLRDIAMMENLEALLESSVEDAKLIVSARNGHISLESPPLVTMGELLRKKHGTKYVGIGLLFGRHDSHADTAVQECALQNSEDGVDADSDGTAPMVRAGHPFSVLDLRRLPGGVIHDWFAAPRPVREVGAPHADDPEASSLQVLPRRYDVVAFVARTTPARTNPTAPSSE